MNRRKGEMGMQNNASCGVFHCILIAGLPYLSTVQLIKHIREKKRKTAGLGISVNGSRWSTVLVGMVCSREKFWNEKTSCVMSVNVHKWGEWTVWKLYEHGQAMLLRRRVTLMLHEIEHPVDVSKRKWCVQNESVMQIECMCWWFQYRWKCKNVQNSGRTCLNES